MPHDFVARAAAMSKSIRSRRFMKKAAPRVEALIASFPKCGRTWLRFAMANYFAEAFRLRIAPDLHTMFSIIPNFDADPVRGMPSFAYSHARPAMPLICVSHAAAAATPLLPIIFLARDPRDVVVSNYFHATRHKKRFTGTIAEFIDEPTHGLDGYIHYLNQWAAFLSRTRHHVTSYECMSAAGGDELTRILEFLGLRVHEEHLATALRRSTFDSMHAHERAEGIPKHDYDRSDTESMRMRKGVAHGYGDYLTSEQIALIERRCRTGLSAKALQIIAKCSDDFAEGAASQSARLRTPQLA